MSCSVIIREADGNKHSDPQPDIMQSVETLEHSVQNRMFSSYPPLREKGTR